MSSWRIDGPGPTPKGYASTWQTADYWLYYWLDYWPDYYWLESKPVANLLVLVSFASRFAGVLTNITSDFADDRRIGRM